MKFDYRATTDKAVGKVFPGITKIFGVMLGASGLLLLSLSVTFGVLAPIERGRLHPPQQMETVQDFSTRFAHECDWRVVDIGERTFYEARKPLPKWTLPSGKACYIFDEKGHLLDWTQDNGDDPRWNKKWGQTEGRRIISFDQIIEKIEAGT